MSHSVGCFTIQWIVSTEDTEDAEESSAKTEGRNRTEQYRSAKLTGMDIRVRCRREQSRALELAKLSQPNRASKIERMPNVKTTFRRTLHQTESNWHHQKLIKGKEIETFAYTTN